MRWTLCSNRWNLYGNSGRYAPKAQDVPKMASKRIHKSLKMARRGVKWVQKRPEEGSETAAEEPKTASRCAECGALAVRFRRGPK